MNFPGLDFHSVKTADALRDRQCATSLPSKRAARRRDRPQRPFPDGSCGARWASSGCWASPSPRITAGANMGS